MKDLYQTRPASLPNQSDAKYSLQSLCWKPQFSVFEEQNEGLKRIRALVAGLEHLRGTWGKTPAEEDLVAGRERLIATSANVLHSNNFLRGELKLAVGSRSKGGGNLALLILRVSLLCLARHGAPADKRLAHLAKLSVEDYQGGYILAAIHPEAAISMAKDFLDCLAAAKSKANGSHPAILEMIRSVSYSVAEHGGPGTKTLLCDGIYEACLSKKDVSSAAFYEARRSYVELLHRVLDAG